MANGAARPVVSWPSAYRRAASFYAARSSTSGPTTISRNGSPDIFRIGRTKMQVPLVDVKHVKLHLNLLDAFSRLRQQIETGSSARLPEQALHLDAEKRWAWFVGLAVESRFERWVKRISLARTDAKHFAHDAVPPLDVWMVWHSYMLNPGSFADDCSRHKLLMPLDALLTLSKHFFFQVLVELGDMNKLTPSDTCTGKWYADTGTPFDYLRATHILTHQVLQCPVCETAIKALYLDGNGTGYAQHKFSVKCPACDFVITKDKLAVFRFTSDLSLDLNSETVRASLGLGIYLPGTLRSNVLIEQEVIGRAVKEQILTAAPFKPTGTGPNAKPKSALGMAEDVGWDWGRIKKVVEPKLKFQTSVDGPRIFACYHDQRLFSVELVGAVLRQGSFIKKMRDLHWTEVDYFANPDDELALHHANARYHAFLDLMASSPGSFLVPTLDIDLVWHTHQLTGPRYQTDCRKTVERYVNHDDKVEEMYLSNAFDLTCRAWLDRFKTQYMQCGCPLPGDTIGQRLSRLISHTNSRHRRSALVPPPELPQLLVASHPSDHNSVAVPSRPFYKAHRSAHEEKMRHRQHRASASDHGGFEYPPAFLVPVPLLWGGAGECVAAEGNVIDAGPGGWGGFTGCSSVSLSLWALDCT
ncbi:hypothetical protein FA95DRAFT_1628258 [Auriscalpium vulgare]|uniref:Uncharacterized protein n=1 Tax=Auriscalpium vulgare TaxID=40419 RepID=A0ACB8S4Y6_9AGAM|nr:hypothetical protein FA95DRAFT_1628258 [Auriscalpium vulgare]